MYKRNALCVGTTKLDLCLFYFTACCCMGPKITSVYSECKQAIIKVNDFP